MAIHITRSGTPAECSATVGPCPLGAHYGSVTEALAAIEEQNKEQELPAAVRKPPRMTDEDIDRDRLIQEMSRKQDTEEPLSPGEQEMLEREMQALNRPDLNSHEHRHANEIALILHYEAKQNKYEQDEFEAVQAVERAEQQLQTGVVPSPAERGDLYALLSNFDCIGNDHDFMDPDSPARGELAERLRTVLRAWEDESQIRQSTGSLWR